MTATLRIFVAMPGSTMGEQAAWHDIDEIRTHLYDVIAERVGQELDRPVKIIIEKEKTDSGDIPRSMFAEALNAEVYIADLTGANANVYLELGVRWSLRDRVTVLLCQNPTADLRFNVQAGRAIRYGPGPADLKFAHRAITRAIVDGLRSDKIDSLVRDALDVVTVSRDKWDRLHVDLNKLRAERADDLVDAALSAEHPEKLGLLRKAIEHYPANYRAHFQLGQALQLSGDNVGAFAPLRRASELNPSAPEPLIKLGLAESRNGDLDAAIATYESALARQRGNVEALSGLAGTLRRKARDAFAQTGDFDDDLLRRARETYQDAVNADRHDTYPAMNVARLSLLLARHDPALRDEALELFRRIELLAQFNVSVEDDRPTAAERDLWKYFDLADAQAMNGKATEATDTARRALEMFAAEQRPSAATSAAQAWRDLVDTGSVPASGRDAVDRLLDLYQEAAGG